MRYAGVTHVMNFNVNIKMPGFNTGNDNTDLLDDDENDARTTGFKITNLDTFWKERTNLNFKYNSKTYININSLENKIVY